MSLRSVIVVILFVSIIAGVLVVAFQNQPVLQSTIRLWGADAAGSDPESGVKLSVWSLILWSFFIGFGIAFGLSTLRSSQQAFGRLRDARGVRRRDRVEKLYAEGLQAVLAENPVRAEERFRAVLDEIPDHVESMMAYGEVLRAEARPREAADLHRRVAESRPDDLRPLYALAADWRADGDIEKARETFERIISSHPKESLRARRGLRDLYLENDRWADVLSVQDSIAAAARDDATRERERRLGIGIRYEIAREAQEAANWREAEKELRALIKSEPSFVPAHLALGETLISAGDIAGAVKAWRRGLETTESPVFLGRLEEHHLGREEPKAIVELMREFVAATRSPAVPTFYLGKLYLRLEMIDDAEAMFSSIEELAPDSLLLRYFRGKILERRGQLKEAAESYRTVVRDSELLHLGYHCRLCRQPQRSYSGRCTACGEWGGVDVEMRGVDDQAEQRLVQRPERASAP